jgi:transcriptional regulator with XRE-family HTH domain
MIGTSTEQNGEKKGLKIMTTGEKISKERKLLNYTQEQLAGLLGVSRQSVSKWESDIAYPETDKLVKMGKLFDCSLDYLLNESVTDKNAVASSGEGAFVKSVKKISKSIFKERKSEKMVFGMPLYHIGKDAKGFFAIGKNAQGVFSVGLKSKGIVSLGLMSRGIISVGVLSLGLLSVGVLSLGLVAIGSVALGLIAIGAFAMGLVAIGAFAMGLYASGAFALGYYSAVGEYAKAMIAYGETTASGSLFSQVGPLKDADFGTMLDMVKEKSPAWLSWARNIFSFFVRGL